MFTTLESGWGLDVVLWLQAHGNNFFDALATILSAAGGDLAYLVALPLIFWSVDRRLGRWLLVVLVTALFVVIGGKEWFARPRPFQFNAELVTPLVTADGNGFPSGHVGVSLAIWGFVALWARRMWGYVLVGVYIALMGWARMYAGVHYPQDVLGGLVVGSVVALGIYTQRERLAALWGWLPTWAQMLDVLVMGALGGVLLRGDDVGLTAAGILIGGGWGVMLSNRVAAFRADGPATQRLLQFAGGVVLTLGVFLLLDAAFAPLAPEAVFRVLRYALVSLVILGLYPLLMVRTGVAPRDTPPDAA